MIYFFLSHELIWFHIETYKMHCDHFFYNSDSAHLLVHCWPNGEPMLAYQIKLHFGN